jgi:hypothetical protein
MPEYLRRFKDTRSKCYNLTIREKDLADLVFAGLSSYLREKLEGQEFLDVNKVLQRAIVHENRTRDHRSYIWFRDSDSKEREKSDVNCVVEESASHDEAEVCVTKWVDMSGDKLTPCSFLKINSGKKDEIWYTFDVMKCDKLFDVLVKGGWFGWQKGMLSQHQTSWGNRRIVSGKFLFAYDKWVQLLSSVGTIGC